MSEVLDVFVQARSFVERQGERLRGACDTSRAKSLMPGCRENLLKQSHNQSYRNPTQVDTQNMGRRSRELSLRNSAKLSRNFGIRDARGV